MSANERQVDGQHYKSSLQHWDYVVANELDYFQAQITKYITRWKKKNGLKDLLKAQHFLEKYIEIEKSKIQIHDTQNLYPYPSGGIEEARDANPASSQRNPDPVLDKWNKAQGMQHPFGYNPEEETVSGVVQNILIDKK